RPRQGQAQGGVRRGEGNGQDRSGQGRRVEGRGQGRAQGCGEGEGQAQGRREGRAEGEGRRGDRPEGRAEEGRRVIARGVAPGTARRDAQSKSLNCPPGSGLRNASTESRSGARFSPSRRQDAWKTMSMIAANVPDPRIREPKRASLSFPSRKDRRR